MSADHPASLADEFSAGIRLEARFAEEHARHYTAGQWTDRGDYLDDEVDETHAEMACLRAKATELAGRRLVARIRARVTNEAGEL